MASLSFIVGLIGNIISILVFASPIATFKRVVKKKSIENYKGLPYVCTLLSTSMWSFYGLVKPGGLLIVTVNGAGTVLEAIYVTLYIIFAPKDTRVKMIKLVALLNIGSLGVVIAVTLLAIHGSLRLLVLGFMCAGLTLGMYASPLGAMRTVIVTKSVEYMPFSLSFFLFLNGGVWSLYAALVKDYFVGVPNAIGFFLGSAQLVLYAVYRRKKPTPKPTAEKDEEEQGSVHLVRDIEMKQREENDEETGKNRALHKERSLPKQGPARLHSLKKIVKANTLNPYELQALRADVENGPGP
ncbi:hypothetical protein AAC387_Pa10g1823 [Persea americana]